MAKRQGIFINRKVVEETNHKIVVILDHEMNSRPVEKVAENRIDGTEAELIADHPRRTLWCCCVEAVVEFHRLITDLFPRGTKQFRLVVPCMIRGFVSTSWGDGLVGYNELLAFLSNHNITQKSVESSLPSSLQDGIKSAVKGIGEMTALQREAFNVLTNSDNNVEHTRRQRLSNRGTLIVLTTDKSLEEYDAIRTNILEQIKIHNCSAMVLEDSDSVTIDNVDLVVFTVSLKEITETLQLDTISGMKMTGVLKSYLIRVDEISKLIPSVQKVCQEMFDLACTKILNIPMKIQNAGEKSQVHSVELLHHRDAHKYLAAKGILKDMMFTDRTMSANTCLNWCSSMPFTEKLSTVDASFAVSPVNVREEAAKSLMRFLRSSRVALLEVPRGSISNSAATNVDINWNKNLISHCLSQSNVTGQIMMIRMPIGADAPKIKAKGDVFDKSLLNYASLIRLMNASTLTSIVPSDVPSNQKHVLFNDVQKKSGMLALRRNIDDLTAHFPMSVNDSFISTATLLSPLSVKQEHLPINSRKRPTGKDILIPDDEVSMSAKNLLPLKRSRKTLKTEKSDNKDVFNLLELYNTEYEKKIKVKSKEFVGREKFGDARAVLYENLGEPKESDLPSPDKPANL